MKRNLRRTSTINSSKWNCSTDCCKKKRLAISNVAGERRWRASQKAGLKKIPAIVKDVSDEKLLELL